MKIGGLKTSSRRRQGAIQQKKSSLKTPCDPKAYTVHEIKGAKLKLKRGEKTKERARNNVKLIKRRPEGLRIQDPKWQEQHGDIEELELDVDLDKIRVLSAPKEIITEEIAEQ